MAMGQGIIHRLAGRDDLFLPLAQQAGERLLFIRGEPISPFAFQIGHGRLHLLLASHRAKPVLGMQLP